VGRVDGEIEGSRLAAKHSTRATFEIAMRARGALPADGDTPSTKPSVTAPVGA